MEYEIGTRLDQIIILLQDINEKLDQRGNQNDGPTAKRRNE